jgi:hypothetical protein
VSELELSEEYNLPNPLLPGTISPAILDRAWDFLSIAPCAVDSEVVAGLLSLVADAALKISYIDLHDSARLDAEIYYNDAAIGLGMTYNGTCYCEEPADD